ncbi:MAG: hypothetical protein AAF984_07425 [Verrucomicrobiota bacterium]
MSSHPTTTRINAQTKPRSKPKPKSKGFALVIALIMILLLTVLVLSFFTKATGRLWITESQIRTMNADIICRAGLSAIEGDLALEIKESATKEPDTSSSLVDQPGFERIIKISRGDTSFNHSEAIINGSFSASTSDQGDFKIPPSEWNKPLFNDAPLPEGSTPNWVYLDKAIEIASSPQKNTVGRFAYIIYDTGALLDANATGHDAKVASELAYKGGPTWFDLEELFDETADPLTQQTITNIPNYRLSDWEDYSGGQAEAFFHRTAFKLPYITPDVSGNIFESRQALLGYFEKRGLASQPSSSHPARYFRTFSSTRSGVSSTQLSQPVYAQNTTIVSYDDQGNEVSYQVKEGDVAIQRKFSLAKLAWLRYDGPNTEAFPQLTEEAIKQSFGLKWNDEKKQWDYTSPDGNEPASSIKDIINSPPQEREPDFFERLKTAFYNFDQDAYSVGTTISNNLCPDYNVLDSSVDLHILQIGSNIIDSADRDNAPTQLAMKLAGFEIAAPGVEDLPYVQTLNFGRTHEITYDSTYGNDADNYYRYDMERMHVTCVPGLFNPHRKSLVPDQEDVVTHIKLEITSGILNDIREITADFVPVDITNEHPYLDEPSLNLPADLSSPSVIPPIIIAASNFESYRYQHRTIGTEHNEQTDDTLIDQGVMMRDNQDAHGWILYDYSDDVTGSPDYIRSPGRTEDLDISVDLKDFQVMVSYSIDGGNTWQAYNYLGGPPGLASLGGIQLDTDANVVGFRLPMPYTTSATNKKGKPLILDNPFDAIKGNLDGGNRRHFLLIDPRTDRFGPIFSARNDYYPYIIPETSEKINATLPYRDFQNGVNQLVVQEQPGFGDPEKHHGKNLILEYMVSGSFDELHFADPDGVTRIPDAALDDEGNPFTKANYEDPAHPGRPLVLNRPFRSVGELGYVYRDVPWKTLDLHNENSGDAKLADLFSVRYEPPVSRGRLNLTSLRKRWGDDTSILQTILQGAGREMSLDDPTTDTIDGDLSSLAATLKTQLDTMEDFSDILEVLGHSEIQTKLEELAQGDVSGSQFSKSRREFLARALLDSVQDSTWNFMVDIIAQSGQQLGNRFIAQAEKRAWLHLAIDKENGKIIDRRIEYITN